MKKPKYKIPDFDFLSFSSDYDWPDSKYYDLACENSRCRFIAGHLNILGEIIIHGFKELVVTLREEKQRR
jgi:hypothetical protein